MTKLKTELLGTSPAFWHGAGAVLSNLMLPYAFWLDVLRVWDVHSKDAGRFCLGPEQHAGYSSVGRASDCSALQQSDGPWFDSGWPDFSCTTCIQKKIYLCFAFFFHLFPLCLLSLLAFLLKIFSSCAPFWWCGVVLCGCNCSGWRVCFVLF